jgi:queuine tRNA-ribosyltransferase
MTFKITHKDKHTNARIAILKTKSGNIETPFFMPISTKATPKFLNSKHLEQLNAKATISNALILSLRPGTKLIKKLGGIKQFMNFKGINFTDSGGFQMYSPSIYIKSNLKGVHFRNPISGEKIFMTPENNMKIQLDIGSDVAMTLDEMPMYTHSKDQIKIAVEKTSLWAQRCKNEHDKLQKSLPKNKRQLLFGITQGGKYKDLRTISITNHLNLNFDGHSIGGFGLGETKQEEQNIIKLHKQLLSENKPLYLMGIGDPLEILEAIALGCDCFDSRLPTQNARRGTLFTSQGKLKLLNKKHEFSKLPIDKNCNCFVCKTYTRSYIRFLLKEQEPTGKALASYHNLHYLQQIIKEAKIAIKNNKLKQLIKKLKKYYK